MRTSRVHTRSVAMPIFIYAAVVSSLLIALLFVADATLEKGLRVVVTSERVGLPKALAFRFDNNPRRHPGTPARHDVTTCACCRPEGTVGA